MNAIHTSHLSPLNLALSTALAVLSAHLAAHAQTAPDAGQTLQQLQPTLPAPRESAPLTLTPPVQAASLPGGVEVVLKSLSFSGHTRLPDASLRAAVGDAALGQSFDLSGLRGLADRVSATYRAAGYPFARAYLPPQDLQAGALRIDIIEGRYGKVSVLGEDAELATQAQPFLVALQPGDVIESSALERATLILGDQPGIRISPVMRPGAELGSGDLDVRVSRTQRFEGDVGLDNFGNRYSGYHRVRTNLNINSPFMLGDQISLRALASDERLWLGSLVYPLPLGASGLRGTLSYARTSYELGKEFASTEANGTATVSTLGVTYPLLRSQKSNLTLAAIYQSKDLKDNRDATNTREAKSSQSLPISLQFDRRDGLGGGGITYGIVGWTSGTLKLDSALTTSDANNSRGHFDKFNLDLVRLQSIGSAWSLMGRLSAQTASKNLDSSEKFSLGGASGVRAYPTGEATGDEGSLAQVELRYTTGHYIPYLFIDAGTIKTNTKPAVGSTNNKRSLSGAGVGLRYQRGPWNADATVAWRGTGGVPQADTSSTHSPRMWLTVGYRL